MRLLQSPAGLLLALVLGIAPSASARGVDPALLAQVHRVAIIVSLGDQADIMLRGLTIFDTKGGHLPLPGSDLDDAATRQVVALVGPRFAIVPLTYDKTSFIPGDNVNPGYGAAPSLKTLIRAMPPAAVDAYLVIRKQDFFLPYPDRYVMDGLGALRYRRLLPKGIVPNVNGIVFVDLEATLVQAGTGKILIDKYDLESVPEDEGDWADTPKAMTDTQAAKLRGRLAELVPKAVAACLAKMQLSAPAP